MRGPGWPVVTPYLLDTAWIRPIARVCPWVCPLDCPRIPEVESPGGILLGAKTGSPTQSSAWKPLSLKSPRLLSEKKDLHNCVGGLSASNFACRGFSFLYRHLSVPQTRLDGRQYIRDGRRWLHRCDHIYYFCLLVFSLHSRRSMHWLFRPHPCAITEGKHRRPMRPQSCF